MTTIAELVSEAKASVENLTPHDIDREQSRGALFVDIREPAELEAGTLEGAVHAPRGMLEFYADPASPYHRDEFQPDRRIVLYCASGGRSALAAQSLMTLGYTDVAHLDGGVKGWAEAGRSLTAVARVAAGSAR